MKSLLVKSEQQKEAVRTSPEFLRCTQEEQLERPLVHVCELVRHQAASVDEVKKYHYNLEYNLRNLHF